MISYISHEKIDVAKWNACIGSSFNGKFFAFSWILDILMPGWNALILDDYRAVLPVAEKKKYGIKYVFQPFFIQCWDIYTPDKNVYEQAKEEFLTELSVKYNYIDICIAPQLKVEIPYFQYTERRAQQLSLKLSGCKGYSENAKRNNKKALKAGLTIETDGSIDKHVADFKKENSKKIKAFSSRDYENMKAMLKELQKRDRAFIVCALTEKGDICASASFIKEDKTLIYFKSSANGYGKKTGAMHLVMDHVIKQYTDKFDILDFYGSDIASVARFNKGLGANDYIYYKLKKNKLPALIRMIKK